jgi:hypothetical protein
MTDWTLIGTTVGAAAVTGAFGYGAAWLQARTQIHQADAELRRLRAQHAEDHLRNRQGTYHSFLSGMQEFEGIADRVQRAGGGTEYEEAFYEWRQRQDHLYSGVRLFGSPEVVPLVETFHGDFLAFGQAARAELGAERLLELEARWRASLAALTEAMRHDVQPRPSES